MIFQADLISSEKHRKYKNLRLALFIPFIFLMTPFFISEESVLVDVWKEDFFWGKVYIIITIILSIIYYFVDKFTIGSKIIGQLIIKDEMMELKTNSKTYVFPFQEIKKLRLERGTYYHNSDGHDSSFNGDNWIIIVDKNGIESKFEFNLDSLEHSNEFEKLYIFFKKKNARKVSFYSV